MSRLARTSSLVTVLVAVLADAAWLLHLVGARLVDEDGAIYWFAARELVRLRFHEPFFYGQPYHHLGEAFVAAPAVVAGLPPWIVLPAVSALVGLATWAVLARLAWRRGAFGLALLLLGAPLLLPVGYAILQQRFFGAGLLLVALGLLSADAGSSAWRGALAGFLLALGPLLVPNAAPLAAVGLAWLAVARMDRPPWRWLLAGAVAAAALHGLGRTFYRLDPGWALHPAPAVIPDWSSFATGITGLGRHLGRLTPGLLLRPEVLLASTAIVALVAAARKRWEVAAPAATLLCVTLLALSVGKVHDGTPSVFFAFERSFLGLPLGLGIVAIGSVGAGIWRGGTSTRAVVACSVVLLCAATWRWTFLAREVAAERAVPVSVLDLREVPAVAARCSAIASAARSEGAGLVVFQGSRTLAYACGALADDRLTTLFPAYERRTWILRDEARRQRDTVLFPDADPARLCGAVQARLPAASCQFGPAGTMVVRMPPTSAVELLRILGLPVRPF